MNGAQNIETRPLLSARLSNADLSFSRCSIKSVGALLLSAVFVCSSCDRHPQAPPNAPNVLLIVIDTLRWDRVSCYGSKRKTTPNIDRWADGSVRFERAYSTAPWTIPSVASMFTGLTPSAHNVSRADRLLADELETLPEILRNAGYATAGVVSNQLIGTGQNFQQGFDLFLESEAQGRDHVSTPGVTRQAIEQLERLAKGDQPFFLFVHYFDPHYKYNSHSEYGYAARSCGRLDGTQKIGDLRSLASTMTTCEIGFLRDRYAEEIRYTDDGIGRLLARVETLGINKESLTILTADHGEEFLDHEWIDHISTLYEELIRAPLIIRLPGAPVPRVVNEPVSLLSLTPTILDLAGISQGAESFMARPLRPLLEGESSADSADIISEVDYVPTVLQGRFVVPVHKKAIIRKGFKLIRDDQTGKIELYDLSADPLEKRNLADTKPQLRDELTSSLDERLEAARDRAVDIQERKVESREVESMRGLGYVGEPDDGNGDQNTTTRPPRP